MRTELTENNRFLGIYVWKLNQTVLELDFRAVKFLFFPRRDLNPHHWYTYAFPFYLSFFPTRFQYIDYLRIQAPF
jgi:hypothetical protein